MSFDCVRRRARLVVLGKVNVLRLRSPRSVALSAQDGYPLRPPGTYPAGHTSPKGDDRAVAFGGGIISSGGKIRRDGC